MLLRLPPDGDSQRKTLEPLEVMTCGRHGICVGGRPAVQCVARLLPGPNWLRHPRRPESDAPSMDAVDFSREVQKFLSFCTLLPSTLL